MYEEGTPQPGLYAHLQGVKVETLGDPLVVATAIAKSLDRDINLPTDWQGQNYEIRPAIPGASEEYFQEELSDLQSELISTIQTRGYWKVVIRPERYDELRIPDISQLQSIVDKCRVRRSGWHFPHGSYQADTQRGINWVGQEYSELQYQEVWRLYQSGQFVYVAGFVEDWGNDAPLGRGRSLFTHNIAYYPTLAYEFAENLAQTEAGDDNMVIEISANGLSGRVLATRKRVLNKYKASLTDFPHRLDISRKDLIDNARTLALIPAIELFKRFGWDARKDQVRQIQEGLR